jgi:hypothetical protein
MENKSGFVQFPSTKLKQNWSLLLMDGNSKGSMQQGILTINVTVVYLGREIMILIRANPVQGPLDKDTSSWHRFHHLFFLIRIIAGLNSCMIYLYCGRQKTSKL